MLDHSIWADPIARPDPPPVLTLYCLSLFTVRPAPTGLCIKHGTLWCRVPTAAAAEAYGTDVAQALWPATDGWEQWSATALEMVDLTATAAATVASRQCNARATVVETFTAALHRPVPYHRLKGA